MPDQPTRDLVGVAGKGLDVMAILAAHPAGLTLTEMAAEAGLTRAGARRLLLTLVADRLCRAGRPRLHAVAAAARPRPALARRHFAVDLRRAAHARGGGALRRILLGRGACRRRCRLCRARARRAHHERRAPCRHPAAGLLHLDGPRAAVGPSEKRTRGAAGQGGDPGQHAEDRDRPRQAWRGDRQGRRDGFAIVDEELEIGLRSIAVPIRDRAGKIVAAINVSTQSARFSPGEMERNILPPLRQAAARIEDFFVVH